MKQIVYVVTAREKFTVLYNQIQQFPDSRMLIFCNRRNTTEDVAASLARRGIRCEMLSGDVNQNRRLRVLEDFREGKVRIVVATDVAGRGLHVDDIGFVINFDFPYEPEDYVHRIGRTGRAGASGTAISFADEDESFIIPDIEKYIGEELKCTVLQHDDPLLAKLPDSGREGHRGPRREHRPAAGEQAPRETPPAAARTAPAAQPPHGEMLPPAEAEQPAPAPAPARPHPEALPAERPAPAAEAKPAAENVQPRPPQEPRAERPRPPQEPRAERPRPPQEPRAERPREPQEPRAERPREPQPPRPAAPAPAPAAGARRPRFSEEWVPGQSPK